MDSYGQIVLFLLFIFFHEGWSLRCACTTDLKLCASIHETPADFQSAKSACKAMGGELMRAGTSLSNETITALLTDTTGDFWSEVETKDKSAGNKTRTVPRCLAVSKVKKWTERACEHRVDGFLCVGVRWDATCSVDTAQTAIIMDKSACSMAPCEHACKEIGNGYTCHCKKTHRPQRKDPRRCDYFCLSTPCKQLCDIPGSCKCPEGFVQDSDTCADIDECTSNHNCQHTCHNTLGSYECSCNEGFDLVNGSACVSRFTTTTEGMFITPSLNHSLSGRATLASPGEYVGIVVFVLAALFGLLLVARYLRKRKSKVGLKDCDDLDIVPQEL